MSRREDHERKSAEWLEHLQSWKDSGESLSAYARSRHLPLWALYHWRKILQREERWSEEPRSKGGSKTGAHRVPLRFARVAVNERTEPSRMTVRVQLLSRRHVEIELDSAGQLAEVLEVLERPS